MISEAKACERDREWLAAHVYNLHRHPREPCECGFCVGYRWEHGEEVDPWVGPWETRRVTYR